MASAQVLPSSRKQEHLEAGKRRLEEFRKKKAAERAKKVAATSQPLASDIAVDQKQPLEAERVRLPDPDGGGTSNGPGRTVEPYNGAISNENNITNMTKKAEQTLLKDTAVNPFSTSDSITSSGDLMQRHINNHDFNKYDGPVFAVPAENYYSGETDEMNNESKIYAGSQGGVAYGISSDHSTSSYSLENQGFDSRSSQSTRFQSIENNIFSKDSALTSLQDSVYPLKTKSSYANIMATGVDFIEPNNNLRGSIAEVEQVHGSMHFDGPINSDFGERNFSSLTRSLPSTYGKAAPASESISFNSDLRSSSNQVQLFSGLSESNSRRSRPSFLDSLNVSRSSSQTSFQSTEPQKHSFMASPLKPNGIESIQSSAFQKPPVENETVEQHSMKFSVSSTNGVDLVMPNLNENSLDRKREFYSSKQNEDFAALEQHIEDLTQEKFSLQRELEASRVLADSLAAENSSLTDNYNQQRSVVNQLKSDMEKLQEEIKAHLVELESVKMEYANAKLECNAADERGKILAAEVIGLEEKALRLRSNELKLERQLENSYAEIASYKKKMSTLEKDRQDLQSTIDALQEEKKLLQSKLRKASASEKFTDVSKNPGTKKDMSTSTEDLDADAIPGTSNQETHDTNIVGSDTSGFPTAPDNRQSNLEDSSVYIPSDQMRMIENINTLISELALEKEELMRALASESSQCSRLKDLNNELSRKLEAQTQRLELLTAQSMANENAPISKLPDSRPTQENITYADEGDEVVERVLGWIMKLFPGGPSRRRTSKLL